MDKGLKLSRSLFEVNNETMMKIAELSAENFKKYLELNQSYVERLPEVRDVSTFVELQRDYGQNLWEGVQSDVKARTDIVREAVETTGSLVREVFTEASEDVKQKAENVAEAVAA
jgi:hypothetical protein